MEDALIVDLYWARDEQALAETAAKFGTYCRKIADNILHSAHDAEECENDTWLAAWNSMPTNRPARLAPYLGRITRNLALDRFDKASALSLIHIFYGHNAEEIIRDAFHVEPEGDIAKLPGVVSRKKQLIPPLLAALQARQ